MNTEIKTRVIEVAEKILAESGNMPTVAEVRSTAQTDMNITTTVMREWRKQKLERKSEEQAPVAVQEDALALAAKIWARAKQQAEENLVKATADARIKNDEAEKTIVELSNSYDSLAAEFKKLQDELSDKKKVFQQLESDKAKLQQAEQAAATKAEVTNAKNMELEKYVTDLKNQLDKISEQKEQETKAFKEAAVKDTQTRLALENELAKAQKSVSEKMSEINGKAAIIEQLQERISEYKEQIREYKEQVKTSEKLKAESVNSAIKAESDLASIKDQLKQAQEAQAKLQTLLEQALKPREEKITPKQ